MKIELELFFNAHWYMKPTSVVFKVVGENVNLLKGNLVAQFIKNENE